MAQVESAQQEIVESGAQWVFIAAERKGVVSDPAKYLTEHPISFPYLLDEDRKVSKAYGVYHRIGLDAINIAHPATLVIAPNGTVQYIYRGDHQFDRAPLQQILDVARKLSAGPGSSVATLPPSS